MALVLGLDLGARSIGWALLEKDGDDFRRIVRAGVRVFEAGTEGDIEGGRDEARGATRRMKRLARRQIRRRRQRARALYRVLAAAGLLPAVEPVPGRPMSELIQDELNRLDAQLRAKYASEPCVHQLPYLLRARALDHALEAYELGRALYHLGQRRGFKSNRKAKAGKAAGEGSLSKAEDRGVVYGGIEELRRAMEEAGARTLGEYLSRLDPSQERIRNRYTHRSMYEQEFEKIWEAQRPHHKALTQALKDSLWEILFRQRPLRGTEDLVGECSWLPGEKRAPVWALEYQRYRLWAALNHLRVSIGRSSPRRLTEKERAELFLEMDCCDKLTVTRAKKLLGLPTNAQFTLEEGGEKHLPGNKVGAQFQAILKDRWRELSFEQQSQLVRTVAEAESDEQLEETLRAEWQFDVETARRVVEEVDLPSGYAMLSLLAIQKVLPELEQGYSVQEARQRAGIPLERQVPVHELLPPLAESKVPVYNPAVKRTLTEMRKVVNAVVRKYGKPDEIHLETARELRKSRAERERDVKRMRSREEERSKIRERIHREVGIPLEKISREDILKGMLWEECQGQCPYCGKSLGGFASLFREDSQVQIEHIIPFSRSLDNSFVNLTLAHIQDNKEKDNRTPWQAYGANEDRWEEILRRVENFQGSYVKAKLNRFKMDETAVEEILEQFSSRHLNDTRASATAAARYLALLYGGETSGGKRKILKLTGQVTAYLRDVWHVNGVIPSLYRNQGIEGSEESGVRALKSRDDHRHHAIDAVVIALCNAKWIQVLSEANRGAAAARRRLFAPVPPPWVGFKEELQETLKTMNISFRPDHRVTGALHKETFYTKSGETPKGGSIVRVRKPVHLLSKEEVDKIADPGVRAVVKARIEELGGKIAKLENNWPLLPNRNGHPVPVKRVRIEINTAVMPVGEGRRLRWVAPGETHHIEIYEVMENGKRKWEGRVVSMWEAIQRVARGEPVVSRSGPADSRFLFSLAKQDTVRLKGERNGIWVVKKIRANTQVMLVPQYDARREGAREAGDGANGGRTSFSPTPAGLLKHSAEKVVVLPIGDVVPCHE